jgi:hypothetical protein
MAIHNGWLKLIDIKKLPKKYYVDKWLLMIGLFINCKRMVSSCKSYTLVKG